MNKLKILSKIVIILLSLAVVIFFACQQPSGGGGGGDDEVEINNSGLYDTTFNKSEVGANFEVASIVTQPDGKILICGSFTSYNGTGRNRISRLNNNGSLDTSFDPGTGTDGYVGSLALQPDGKIIIAGEFTSYNGVGRNCIARINVDGTLDLDFKPGSGSDQEIIDVKLQPDGKILICGSFTTYDGVGRNHIARLNNNGSIDVDFNPGTGANNQILKMAIQTDGKILIGGTFTSYNEIARNYFAKLNSDGSLDLDFDPISGPNNNVESLALQPDGKILIGGFFTSYNGTERNRIARVNNDGTLDAGFDPGSGVNSSIKTIEPQSDGKILIGGLFTTYDGVDRNHISRLSNNGTLDTSFNPGSGANDIVFSIEIHTYGKILIGGAFTTYNSVDVPDRIIRLYNWFSYDKWIILIISTFY